MGAKIELSEIDGELQNDGFGNAMVNTPLVSEEAGFAVMASEVDPGAKTGDRYILPPEVDQDYRMRVALDTIFDDETFNYGAQNTGKHNNQNATMTYVYGTGGLLTNGTSITTVNQGLSLSTYAMFPFFSSGISDYIQFEGSFSSQPVANLFIDIGAFLRPTSQPYAPTDGVYFRLTSAGLMGVINHNGTETTTAPFSGFSYINSQVYKFLIVINSNQTEFWIDDVLYGVIATPTTQAQPFMSVALPFAFRHMNVGGAAGGVMQFTLRGYGISTGGSIFSRTLGELGNAIFGSYQGLSGGTMGTIGIYTNSTNPTAAVPTNTTNSTGSSGLLNQSWETFSLAVNTDGVLLSYQNPAGTVSVPGKRLKIVGVKLASFVQTILAGGPAIRTFALAFGHTAVSLTTAEAATTKQRRIVLLPELTQAIVVNQAVSTILSQPLGGVSMFPEPIYVNPGEFVQVTEKIIGTVGTSGTIVNHIQLIYAWE